jgi:hypothetical protein
LNGHDIPVFGAYGPGNGNTVTFESGYDSDNSADPLNPADALGLYSDATPTTFSVTTRPRVQNVWQLITFRF